MKRSITSVCDGEVPTEENIEVKKRRLLTKFLQLDSICFAKWKRMEAQPKLDSKHCHLCGVKSLTISKELIDGYEPKFLQIEGTDSLICLGCSRLLYLRMKALNHLQHFHNNSTLL